MTNEPSRPLVNTLVAERAEAHRHYNEALTALDLAIQALPNIPPIPAPYDEQMLPAVNEARNVFPAGSAARLPGWRGRLSDVVWQLVTPAFERQAAFNAALVDHLNRNVAAHREAHDAIAAVVPAMREGFEALVRFESLLVQFLQRITPLADANTREVHETIAQLRNVADVAQRAAIVAKREVDRIGAGTPQLADASAPRGDSPGQPARTEASKYLGFEDRFRGSEDEIRRRLADYVPLFEGASDVLDIGCGRGEFLDLLRARENGEEGR